MNERVLNLSSGEMSSAQQGETEALIASLPIPAQRMFERQGILGLGEAYRAGLWDVPRLDQFMHRLFTSPEASTGGTPWGMLLRCFIRETLLNIHAPRWAFNIGEQHYDLGNDLFTAMLDRSMTYTCGYWNDAESLDDAQDRKLELICKKLGIKQGDHVLDIGCGWGNFAKYAAENYGARITGVTVSKEQASLAKQRCLGLPVEILLQDYRSLKGQFDHVVSIEMIEAVGRRNIPTFFKTIHRNLKPGGRALVQAITADTFSRTSDRATDQFTLWIMKRIFPDGYLPSIHELMEPTKQLFHLEDVHGFGPDYDKTLMAWSANFKREWPSLMDSYGETFRRTWIFYLESCAALFRSRRTHLFQVLYSKPVNSI